MIVLGNTFVTSRNEIATDASRPVHAPAGYETLLERALYGHLATTRPDSNPQVNVPLTEPPAKKVDRVILVVRPTGCSKQ